MKEKQTYTNLKEYGHDMSYENESSISNEDRGELDLTFLLEKHDKEKWELKKQLSKAAEELTVLQGTKELVNRLASENTKLKKQVQEVEGENTIIKGIGNNSPEMRKAHAELKEAREINRLHQELNGKLQVRVTELERDNKILTKQISDHIKKYEDNFRKAGM